MRFIDKVKMFFGYKTQIEQSNVTVPRDDYSYNELKFKKQQKLDQILDKISKKGIESLSKKEKEFLDNESK